MSNCPQSAKLLWRSHARLSNWFAPFINTSAIIMLCRCLHTPAIYSYSDHFGSGSRGGGWTTALVFVCCISLNGYRMRFTVRLRLRPTSCSRFRLQVCTIRVLRTQHCDSRTVQPRHQATKPRQPWWARWRRGYPVPNPKHNTRCGTLRWDAT